MGPYDETGPALFVRVHHGVGREAIMSSERALLPRANNPSQLRTGRFYFPAPPLYADYFDGHSHAARRASTLR